MGKYPGYPSSIKPNVIKRDLFWNYPNCLGILLYIPNIYKTKRPSKK